MYMANNRHAYLIMAHNEWELLNTLLSLIDDPRNDIFLHIDKKVKTMPVLKRSSVISLRITILLRVIRITLHLLEVFCMMSSSIITWVVMMFPLGISSYTTSRLITSIQKRVLTPDSLLCILKMISFLITTSPTILPAKKKYKMVRSSCLQNKIHKQIRVVGRKSLPLKFVFEQIL